MHYFTYQFFNKMSVEGIDLALEDTLPVLVHICPTKSCENILLCHARCPHNTVVAIQVGAFSLCHADSEERDQRDPSSLSHCTVREQKR